MVIFFQYSDIFSCLLRIDHSFRNALIRITVSNLVNSTGLFQKRALDSKIPVLTNETSAKNHGTGDKNVIKKTPKTKFTERNGHVTPSTSRKTSGLIF